VIARVAVLPELFARLARQAGFDPDRIRVARWVARVVGALLLALIAAELRASWILVILVAAAGLIAPDLWLLRRRHAREKKIRLALPFFLEVLVSLLHAGLDLTEALRRAAVRGIGSKHPLTDEILLVREEIDAGRERSDAFRSLAARTNVAELQAVAAALELGARLGVPMAEVLATQAEMQRERRAEAARRRIDRAVLAALLPVILCGLPLFLVIVVTPLVLEIFRTLQFLKQ
jgi:tight adherence protein C